MFCQDCGSAWLCTACDYAAHKHTPFHDRKIMAGRASELLRPISVNQRVVFSSEKKFLINCRLKFTVTTACNGQRSMQKNMSGIFHEIAPVRNAITFSGVQLESASVLILFTSPAKGASICTLRPLSVPHATSLSLSLTLSTVPIENFSRHPFKAEPCISASTVSQPSIHCEHTFRRFLSKVTVHTFLSAQSNTSVITELTSAALQGPSTSTRCSKRRCDSWLEMTCCAAQPASDPKPPLMLPLMAFSSCIIIIFRAPSPASKFLILMADFFSTPRKCFCCANC